MVKLSQDDLPESPLPGANPISKIFLWWLNGLFLKGRKRELEMTDLHQVTPTDQSKPLGDGLAHEWDKELEECRVRIKSKGSSSHRPSLSMAILRQFGREILSFGVIILFEECFIRIAQPLCLGYLIKYVNSPQDFNSRDGYLCAGAIMLLSGLYCVTHHSYGLGMHRLGMNVRIACSSLVYRKVLRLSQSALGKTNVGQLTNLLSNDVSRFDQFSVFIHYLWVMPLQTAITIFILWGFYGPACLAGVAALGVFVLCQSCGGRISNMLRNSTALITDKRIRTMNEIVSGIGIIKMYTWEKPFVAFVDAARKDEIKMIRRTSYLRCFNSILSFISSKIIIFVTLFAYIWTDNALTAEKVFVALSLINAIRYNMTTMFAWAVLYLGEALVSVNRIQEFLLMEERDIKAIPVELGFSNKMFKGDLEVKRNLIRANGIWIKNLTAKWSPSHSENTLSNINLSVNEGEMLAAIGHVGSGKSSIIQAILKELRPSSTLSSIDVSGSIAYAPQEPWVFGGSLKENILFGREYKPQWYNKVIDACALRRDIELFPYGDDTLVGERGVCLSGGQKARITLARAVYSNSDIYLLDDPLSAVDSKVGRHIFEKCICGILANKTRILVTHQLQYLKSVEGRILLLDGGMVKAMGKYSELMVKEEDFAKLVSSAHAKDDLAYSSKALDHIKTDSVRQKDMSRKSESENKGISPKLHRKADPGIGGDDESRKTGSIGLATYWNYFRSGSGYFGLTLWIILSIMSHALLSGADWWLSFWIQTQETDFKIPVNSTDPLFELYANTDIQIVTYSVIIISLLICSSGKTLLFFRICMNSSVNLHERMFKAVIQAPMRFFELNPAGRLLNRISKDIGNIDDLLPASSLDMMDIFLSVLGIFVIVAMVNQLLLIPSIILMVMSYLLRGFYLKTARSVKRLEGVARSPLFSHLSTTFNGLTTVRAFGAEGEFRERFDDLQDMHSSSWFVSIATIRWLAIWQDWMFVFFIGIVTFGLVACSEAGDGAQVGLAVSSVMMLTGMLQWGVKQSAEVENQMVSVERVLEYAGISPEPPLESSKDKAPPKDWPTNGEIVMTNVQLRYDSKDTPVLKGITCTFKSREKIGIVGRTGAGKSSLITALFRLADPTGVIEIDGVNILQIGLHDLRSKISIIPQDPVLFTRSLRKNLDPFDNYKDDEIWKVLGEIQLANEVKLNPAGILMEVAEGGSNFSVGQRQLICLGRAILRKNRILVMDEATANLDNETDALIQRTIRTKFIDCTVLTVAHRLHTVMDSDKILVLDAGSLMEYDEPYILLQDSSSSLHSLVEETGPTTARMLRKIAENAYQMRSNDMN